MHSKYVAESRILIEFGDHNELGRKGGRERIKEGRREGEGRTVFFSFSAYISKDAKDTSYPFSVAISLSIFQLLSPVLCLSELSQMKKKSVMS